MGNQRAPVPQGRLKVAQHAVLGGSKETDSVPQGRLNSSFDFMYCKELFELFREGDPLMMFGLRLDIPHRSRSLRDSDRESSISLLPCKVPRLRKIFMNPLRRSRLQQLNSLRHGNCSRQGKQQVDMINRAAHSQGRDFILSRNASEIGVKPFLHPLRNRGSSFRGSEHHVNQATHVTVRHNFSRPYRDYSA